VTERDWDDGATDIEHAEQRQHEAVQQHAINRVAESYRGRPYDEVLAALRASWSAHGLNPASDQWMEAVAGEISQGHSYTVGIESMHDADELDRPGSATPE
jgi:hypothetical protein